MNEVTGLDAGMMQHVIPAIVDTRALRDLQPAPTTAGELVLADVRWYLDGRDGRASYESGHLPGAVWVDLDRHLAAHDAPATEGRHPFPTDATFADAMSSLGIGDHTIVVAYDDTGGLTAGRLVVMLRMLGHRAAVLDGGMNAWVAEGGELEQGWVAPSTADFTAVPWPSDRLASADDTGSLATGGPPVGVVLDARSRERFSGEVAQIDPRPGHVPGAVNAPWSAVLGPDGRLREPDELRAHFHALGVRDDLPSVTYCGSGVSACMNVLAMERAGFAPPSLYVASWSGWSSDPERPAEMGA